MLNKDTRAILKSLIPINNSMIIEPVMHGADEYKSLLFRAKLNEIEDDIQEFGIFDTSSFLSSLDLLDEAVISFADNRITASDTNSTLTFITSDISALEDITIKPSVIDTTLIVDSIVEFGFGSDLLARIKKASGVFKSFDTLFIINNGKNIQLKMGTKDSFSKSNNSFAINVDTDVNTGKEFELALPLESISKIPSMNYTLHVKYNTDKDAYRVVLDNTLLTFVMSLMR